MLTPFLTLTLMLGQTPAKPKLVAVDELPSGVMHVHAAELAVQEREKNRAIRGRPFDGKPVQVKGRFRQADRGRRVILEDVRKEYADSTMVLIASADDWKVAAGFKPGDLVTVEGIVSNVRDFAAPNAASLVKPRLVTARQPELRGRPSEAP